MTGRQINLIACGDINIQHRDEPARVFELVTNVLAAADVRLGNMEMCLTSSLDIIEAKAGWTQSDARMVDALVSAGFDGVTTGNNVTFGAETIPASLKVLDANGILHTGSGSDIAEARVPVVIQRDGTSIGLLGYSCVVYPVGHEATDVDPGVAAVRCHTSYEPHRRVNELPGAPPIVHSWPDSAYLEAVRADIDKLRPDVDVLIVYFHMGVSSQEEITEYQRLLSRATIDFGADAVLGSSAHKPQAMQMYKGKPIFYGLGNFAFDWPKLADRRSGLLADFEIAEGRITRVAFRPVTRRDPLNRVEFADPSEGVGKQIADRVAELSAELGTNFVGPDGEGRVIVWTEPAAA